MSTENVYNLTGSLLVKNQGFEQQEGYLAKNIKVDGSDNLIMFRQNDDYLELINVSRNELMLDKQIIEHDSKLSEEITNEVYNEITEKLSSLENEPSIRLNESTPQINEKPIHELEPGSYIRIENSLQQEITAVVEKPTFVSEEDGYIVRLKDGTQKAYEFSEIKRLANESEIAQFKSANPELSNNEIIKEARVQLKVDGKLGADFGKSSNGLSIASGDYIKLNSDYSNKDSLFSKTELPKNAELKITGSFEKKDQVYAKAIYQNSKVEVNLSKIDATYSDKYVDYYNSNQQFKQAVDNKVNLQRQKFSAVSTPNQQPKLNNSTPENKPKATMKM